MKVEPLTPFSLLRSLGADLALARRFGLRLRFARLRLQTVLTYLVAQAVALRTTLATWRTQAHRSVDWSGGDPGMAWLAFAAGALATLGLLMAGLLGLPLPARGIAWAEALLAQASPAPPEHRSAPALALFQES